MTVTDNNELIINIDGKTQCITKKQIENAFSAPKTACANYERDNEEQERKVLASFSDSAIKEVIKSGKIEEYIKPKHYNNEGGSLYSWCEKLELNTWEFDILKRVIRCRKKGQFKEDLEKTKFLIDLYLKEYTDILIKNEQK